MSAENELVVRTESMETDERSVIHAVNEAAFGRPDEADLIDRLHAEQAVLLSLVGELDQRIIGHVLFSRMHIETAAGPIPAAALAPVSVLPEQQRRGVGARLIARGLALLRPQGESIVIVLGHPDYYARFGFRCDKARFLESPFPPEAFMALELSPKALLGVRGKVRYPAAFGL